MRPRLFDCALAATILAFAVSGTAAAMGPEPPQPQPNQSAAPKQDGKSQSDKKKEQKKDKKKDQQTLLETPAYRTAYDLIYTQHDYAAGFAKLRTLNQDDNAEIANLLGYTSRKLGNYDASKYWYERALAANPQHARTWSYYGMWHAEQGNLLKAQDYLAKVASICGTGCKEYTELKGVIEGTHTY
jgi:tetratricopeptide (TPR) repeat protein